MGTRWEMPSSHMTTLPPTSGSRWNVDQLSGKRTSSADEHYSVEYGIISSVGGAKCSLCGGASPATETGPEKT